MCDKHGTQDIDDLVEIAKSVLLAALLVMMRIRQVQAGQGTHSKQRERIVRSPADRREPRGVLRT